MSESQEYVAKQELWNQVAGEKLLVVRPDWRVEYGGKIMQEYGALEAVCLSALMVRVNELHDRRGLLESVGLIDQRVEAIGASMPFTGSAESSMPKPVVTTLIGRRTDLRPFLFRLGKPPFQADILFDKAGDERYGAETLITAIGSNSRFENLSTSMLASFHQKFVTDWGKKSSHDAVHEAHTPREDVLKKSDSTSTDNSIASRRNTAKRSTKLSQEVHPYTIDGVTIIGSSPSFSLSGEAKDIVHAQLDKVRSVIRTVFGATYELDEIFKNSFSAVNSMVFLKIYELNGRPVSLREICDDIYDDFGRTYPKELFEKLFTQEVIQFIREH